MVLALTCAGTINLGHQQGSSDSMVWHAAPCHATAATEASTCMPPVCRWRCSPLHRATSWPSPRQRSTKPLSWSGTAASSQFWALPTTGCTSSGFRPLTVLMRLTQRACSELLNRSSAEQWMSDGRHLTQPLLPGPHLFGQCAHSMSAVTPTPCVIDIVFRSCHHLGRAQRCQSHFQGGASPRWCLPLGCMAEPIKHPSLGNTPVWFLP